MTDQQLVKNVTDLCKNLKLKSDHNNIEAFADYEYEFYYEEEKEKTVLIPVRANGETISKALKNLNMVILTLDTTAALTNATFNEDDFIEYVLKYIKENNETS